MEEQLQLINTVDHHYYGKLYCYGETKDNPLMWGTRIAIALFSEYEKEVFVALHLYCYNKHYEYTKYYEDKVATIEANLKLTYEYFINNIETLENQFLTYFQQYFYDEFEVKCGQEQLQVSSIKELYSYIRIKEVRIFSSSYAVILELAFIEEAIGIYVGNIGNDPWFSVNQEDEIDIVEMAYN